MWLKYKSKQGDTLESIAKAHKLKKPDPLLQHPKNTGVYTKIRKNKGVVPPGTLIYVPDPRVKVYRIKNPNTGLVEAVEAREYAHFMAQADSMALAILDRWQAAFGGVEARYKGLEKVHEDSPVITFLTSSWTSSKGDKPVAQHKAAKASVDALEKIYKSKKYDQMQAQEKECQRTILAFRKGYTEWESLHTNSAQRWADNLKTTETISYVVLGAAATAMAAPATPLATVLVGGGVGGGAGFTKALIKEGGRGLAGYKMDTVESAKNIASSTLQGIALGGVFGGLGGKIGPQVLKKLMPIFQKNMAARSIALKIVKQGSASRFVDKAIWKEVNKMFAETAKEVGDKSLIAMTKSEIFVEINTCSIKVMARFIMCLQMGALKKKLGDLAKDSASLIENWWKTKGLNLSGRVDEGSIADGIAAEIAGSQILEKFLDEVVVANWSDFEKQLKSELDKELKSLKERLVKEAQAQA